MKTIHLVLLTGLAIVATGKLDAQGTILLNNYDSKMGIFDIAGGPVPALAGTRVEVLAGPSPSSMTPIMAANGHGPIFEILPEGEGALGPGLGSFFDEGYGVVLSVPPGGTVYLNVHAWTAAFLTWESSYVRGETGVWSQQIGSAGTPAALAMPWPVYITLIPEPSTIALAALGLAACQMFGRRKSRPTTHV